MDKSECEGVFRVKGGRRRDGEEELEEVNKTNKNKQNKFCVCLHACNLRAFHWHERGQWLLPNSEAQLHASLTPNEDNKRICVRTKLM